MPEGILSVNISDRTLQDFRNTIRQRESLPPAGHFPASLNIESADNVSVSESSDPGSKMMTAGDARALRDSSAAQACEEKPHTLFSSTFKKVLASAAILFSAFVSSGSIPPVQAAPLQSEISRTMVEAEKNTVTNNATATVQVNNADSAAKAQKYDGEYVASTGDWHYKSDEAYKDFEPVNIMATKRIAVKHGAGRKTTYRTVKAEVDIAPYILASAKKHDVSPYVIKAMIAKESTFNPKAHSGKGACGLMQVLPGTAREMGVRNHWDPESNIEAGTKYISNLLDQFDNLDKALSAYNTGPNNVRKSKHGIPRYTRGYISKIMDFMRDNTGPSDV